uniref:MOB kinase activator 2 n=2 Tax=Canis lupus familiaris TaxID=9615 RepID=A0A8I3NNC8_CANLF
MACGRGGWISPPAAGQTWGSQHVCLPRPLQRGLHLDGQWLSAQFGAVQTHAKPARQWHTASFQGWCSALGCVFLVCGMCWLPWGPREEALHLLSLQGTGDVERFCSGGFHTWFFSSLTATTFFHHVNLQYSTISEFCTGEACQTMAVCNTQYYWYDERGKKVKCTAPQYVDFVMSSVQKLVTDEDVFPTKYGREFPSSFESLVKKICKYLFHVLAHIYWSHFKETLALELHGHLNTLYVHFILFAREFNLLDPKETAVMDDLTEVLCSAGGRGGGGGDGASGGGTGAQNHVKER